MAPLEGSDLCFTHHPKAAEARAARNSKGGRGSKRKRPGPVIDVDLRSREGMLSCLESEARAVMQLESSVGRSRAIAYLCATALKIHEAPWAESFTAATSIPSGVVILPDNGRDPNVPKTWGRVREDGGLETIDPPRG